MQWLVSWVSLVYVRTIQCSAVVVALQFTLQWKLSHPLANSQWKLSHPLSNLTSESIIIYTKNFNVNALILLLPILFWWSSGELPVWSLPITDFGSFKLSSCHWIQKGWSHSNLESILVWWLVEMCFTWTCTHGLTHELSNWHMSLPCFPTD